MNKSIKTIFILEDNEDLRDLYAFIFDPNKYQLETFPTVATFMAATNRTPDLYLLDIMLPDGDGISVCKHLHTNNLTHNIPVILISAHQQASIVVDKCPWASFIEKPFDIDSLELMVESRLAQV